MIILQIEGLWQTCQTSLLVPVFNSIIFKLRYIHYFLTHNESYTLTTLQCYPNFFNMLVLNFILSDINIAILTLFKLLFNFHSLFHMGAWF